MHFGIINQNYNENIDDMIYLIVSGNKSALPGRVYKLLRKFEYRNLIYW